MSATPEHVQALIDVAVSEWEQATSTYAQMVKKYGRDTTKWPPPAHTSKMLSALGKAREDAGQLVAPPPPAPSGSCYWGARINGLIYQQFESAPNANYAPWAASDPSPNNWDRFETNVGKKVCSIQWGGNDSKGLSFAFDTNAAKLCHSRGAFSQYDLGPTKQQLLDLAAGSDAFGALTQAKAMASAMGTLGFPIMFRPMWEMNGNWGYAWQAGSVPASTYVLAWRTLRTIFAAPAPNVSFFWCPNDMTGVPDPTPWFPGIDYVDWVGADFYANGAYTIADLADPIMAKCRALAPGKPLAVGETGCYIPNTYPGGKAKAITDFFAWMKKNPDVKWFNYFNDFPISAGLYVEIGDTASDYKKAALAAFQEGISDARYVSAPAASWPSGGKVPVPA